jgi:hypothetical protein
VFGSWFLRECVSFRRFLISRDFCSSDTPVQAEIRMRVHGRSPDIDDQKFLSKHDLYSPL